MELVYIFDLKSKFCGFESRRPYQKYSLLAQLVEHLTVNQIVAGSSPAQGAKTKEGNTQRAGLDGIACAVS